MRCETLLLITNGTLWFWNDVLWILVIIQSFVMTASITLRDWYYWHCFIWSCLLKCCIRQSTEAPPFRKNQRSNKIPEGVRGTKALWIKVLTLQFWLVAIVPGHDVIRSWGEQRRRRRRTAGLLSKVRYCVQLDLHFVYRRFVLSPEGFISSKLAGNRAWQHSPWDH